MRPAIFLPALTRFEARAAGPLSPLRDIDLQLSIPQSSVWGPERLLICQGSSHLGLATLIRQVRGFSATRDGLPVHPNTTVGDAVLDRHFSILAKYAINGIATVRIP